MLALMRKLSEMNESAVPWSSWATTVGTAAANTSRIAACASAICPNSDCGSPEKVRRVIRR